MHDVPHDGIIHYLESRDTPSWSIAVFAHNEAGRIRRALESIPAAAAENINVVVLANGCTDATADVVRSVARTLPNVSLVEIDVADKANAWNVYVHDIIAPDRTRATDTHFFMDGDVTLEPQALSRLVSALRDVPSAKGAGGMPATGRDKDAWRARMTENGMLAGNLYALRGGVIADIRRRGIRIPVGLIGEDFFVSWLLTTDVGDQAVPHDGPPCVFHARAEFSFRSLSRFRPQDYRIYARRKWRYVVRGLQHEMLTNLLVRRGLSALPLDVRALYRDAPLPSRLRWAGLDSWLRTLAVVRIRSLR